MIAGDLLLAGPPSPRFLDDDPIGRELDTQDASGVKPWDIVFAYDLLLNSFARPGDPQTETKAQSVNTIDEVPDSAWFTNRIELVTPDDVRRGPDTSGGPPDGVWTIVGPKTSGVTPGFSIRDATGQRWFIELDPPSAPEGPSAAEVVATKIFWTLGYHQAENYLAFMRPDQLAIDPNARVRTPSGRRRSMNMRDVDAVLARGHRLADGRYRVLASKALPGTPLGGFKYYGTRPDDPNDVIPHEHRRELRALKVFGAWVNLVDQKALNTLDMLVDGDGRRVVRHYLLDVGSGFGTGALGPREWDDGWEYVIDLRGTARRLRTLGLWLAPWERLTYRELPSIGRFEADAFDPDEWRPRVPHAAYLRARWDDNFWAARRVAAFSDDMIRAAVSAGRYSDPEAADHLVATLIARRQKIAARYLVPINPIVDITLTSDAITFRNAATDAGVASLPSSYEAHWFEFDNDTGAITPLGTTRGPSPRLAWPGPDGSAAACRAGRFVRVDLTADSPGRASWRVPVQTFFRCRDTAWTLVGLERARGSH